MEQIAVHGDVVISLLDAIRARSQHYTAIHSPQVTHHTFGGGGAQAPQNTYLVLLSYVLVNEMII